MKIPSDSLKHLSFNELCQLERALDMWATTFSRKRTLSTVSPRVVSTDSSKQLRFTEKHSRALLSCSPNSHAIIRRSIGAKSFQYLQGHGIEKETELIKETDDNSMVATGITVTSDIERLREEHRRLTEKKICREFKSFKSKSSRGKDGIQSSNLKDSHVPKGLSETNKRNQTTEFKVSNPKGKISEGTENTSKASYKTSANSDSTLVDFPRHATEDELQAAFEEKIKELLASNNNKKSQANVKCSPIVKQSKSKKKIGSFENCYLDITPEKQSKSRGRLTKCPSPNIRPKRIDFKVNVNGNVKKISVVGGSPQRRRVSLWKKVILKQHHLACQQYLKSHYGLSS